MGTESLYVEREALIKERDTARANSNHWQKEAMTALGVIEGLNELLAAARAALNTSTKYGMKIGDELNAAREEIERMRKEAEMKSRLIN